MIIDPVVTKDEIVTAIANRYIVVHVGSLTELIPIEHFKETKLTPRIHGGYNLTDSGLGMCIMGAVYRERGIINRWPAPEDISNVREKKLIWSWDIGVIKERSKMLAALSKL